MAKANGQCDAEKVMIVGEFSQLWDFAEEAQADRINVEIVRERNRDQPERVVSFLWKLPPRQ
jgi:hypothetical protein